MTWWIATGIPGWFKDEIMPRAMELAKVKSYTAHYDNHGVFLDTFSMTTDLIEDEKKIKDRIIDSIRAQVPSYMPMIKLVVSKASI
ncbi:DUF1902 domain-containing protein [Caenorhabditis elegans]|uniref:DUF1902 domain-containing protein n=1 Tax=Caenorhabditis elegans TaxID=6239 RepID=O45902_CAEEL|nr:DUF1902 domain-containing protein [Caenorhabditis elegans]CAB04957.2 DUF1902 domain-containing protein [Caenorhabditis elegans]|eukprot:NP_496799.2 Uncharacterized protein CELE_W09H1.4 [Caenorhabditis elegans]